MILISYCPSKILSYTEAIIKEPFKIWKNVYMVGGSDLSHQYDCCVYLIDMGDLVLIDAGAGLSFERLVSNIERLGFNAGNVSTVIATHAHIDHIGSLRDFQDAFGARIAAHEMDADAIESGIGIAAEAYGVDYFPCIVDVRLPGRQEILRFDRGEIHVVHIPGHTPGSVAAYIDIDGKRILFGQDIHGPYIPQWGADPEQASASLQRLMSLHADILCEGHFGIYRPADEVKRYIEYYRDSL